ncbi:hypothetical protein BDN67DRAFT_976564 [Paxillus ammoniavirescens]|nr:hypothetical protein BDN67DRAFT_976564 [Paxillus ammoniavirescens]
MPETQLFRYTVPGLNGYDLRPPYPSRSIIDAHFTRLRDPSMCSQLTHPCQAHGPGNLILTKDGEGLLMDWELAKKVDENVARRRERTFMVLLRNPGMTYTLQDDIESSLHVLVWVCIKYVPTTDACSAKQRGNDLHRLLDVIDFVKDGAAIGITTKADVLGRARTTLASPRTARNLQLTIQVTLHREITHGGREGAGEARGRLD